MCLWLRRTLVCVVSLNSRHRRESYCALLRQLRNGGLVRTTLHPRSPEQIVEKPKASHHVSHWGLSSCFSQSSASSGLEMGHLESLVTLRGWSPPFSGRETEARKFLLAVQGHMVPAWLVRRGAEGVGFYGPPCGLAGHPHHPLLHTTKLFSVIIL